MTRADQQRSEYWQRKAAGRCTSCDCEMLPEWDGQLCPECVDGRARADGRYSASEAGKQRRREWRLGNIETSRACARRSMRNIAAQRIAAGLCVKCGERSPEAGLKQCRPCLRRLAAWKAKSKLRKSGQLTAADAVALVVSEMGTRPNISTDLTSEAMRDAASSRRYGVRFRSRLAELGHPCEEPTEWTEEQKQADRIAEAEEMGWMRCGRVAQNKATREAVDAMDREDHFLFANSERRAA